MSMIKTVQQDDIVLRLYSEDFCVLSKRNGVRRAMEGPMATLIFHLNEAIGLSGILQLVHAETQAASDDVSLIEQRIRELFAEFASREPMPLEKLLGDAPRLLQYAMSNRIPLKGMCEITYHCNLRCTHCYVLHKVEEPQPAHVEDKHVLEILGSLARMGCLDVTITGGEATLHKSWRSIIQVAKSLHLYTYLKTNGTTFTRTRAEAYSQDPAHETHLSLYGASPATHDAFTTIRGSFEKTLKGMYELSRVGVRCKVNCTVWKDNVSELDKITHIVHDSGHYVVFDDIIYGRLNGDRSPHNLEITPAVREQLVAQGYLSCFQVKPCSAGALKVKVDAEGQVGICELLPFALGNAFQSSLEEVWHGPRVTSTSHRIISLSTSERDGDAVTLSCPGLNFLNRGRFEGRTER